MLMHTGTKAITSQNNLVTTIAWQIDNKTEYALEGSVFIAGAIVQWLRDGLKIIHQSKEIEDLAKKVTDTDGVYMSTCICRAWCATLEPTSKGNYCWRDQGYYKCTSGKSCIGKHRLSGIGCFEINGSGCGIRIKKDQEYMAGNRQRPADAISG